jgi:beta-glucosidase
MCRAYFVWSFLDVFEYLFGYQMGFGLYGIDFNSKERTRYKRHKLYYAQFSPSGE